jgi:hypothetical protein
VGESRRRCVASPGADVSAFEYLCAHIVCSGIEADRRLSAYVAAAAQCKRRCAANGARKSGWLLAQQAVVRPKRDRAKRDSAQAGLGPSGIGPKRDRPKRDRPKRNRQVRAALSTAGSCSNAQSSPVPNRHCEKHRHPDAHAVQRSAVQCSAAQRSAVQCSAVQRSAVQCSAVQCSAAQCSAVQPSAPLSSGWNQSVRRR